MDRARDAIVQRQLRFFVEKRAGCLFAAAAARNPGRYGWIHRITPPDHDAIDLAISEAIADPETTTLSLLFPDTSSTDQLLALIGTLMQCRMLLLDQSEEFMDTLCLGFRARVGDAKSYVTGFGDFPFLPVTRRTPCVELTTRVKARPHYDFVFKPAPPGVIHLADMDMRGMPFKAMQRLWDDSFVQTKNVLGAAPDLRSAARTTYSIPKTLYATIP